MSAPDFTARALALKALEGAALSAYDIAVLEGFGGDEEAWLASLVGPEGPAGVDGADGAPGADGADGADGSDGADGADGADGFGAGLGDPGADRLLGWDESAGAGGAAAFFEAGIGISIAGTSLNLDGWVLLDSDTGVSGVTEVAWTGIPALIKDLLIVAQGIQCSESNTISVLLQDGASWAPASTITTITAGSDRAVYAEIAGRHLDWGVIRARAGNAALSSPVVGTYANSQYAFWHCAGGIDGVSVKLGSGDIEAGNFYLYGRA